MTQEERVQYKFMIPVDLKERIENAAHENRRSVSSEIVASLEEKYPKPEPNLLDIARVLQLLPGIEPEKQDHYIELYSEMLKRFRLEVARDNGTLVVRPISSSSRTDFVSGDVEFEAKSSDYGYISEDTQFHDDGSEKVRKHKASKEAVTKALRGDYEKDDPSELPRPKRRVKVRGQKPSTD